MNRVFYTVFLFLLPIVYSSCSVHRRAAGGAQHVKSNDSVVALQNDTEKAKSRAVTATVLVRLPDTTLQPVPIFDSGKIWQEMLKPVWSSRLVYKTFAGKARVHYEAGDNSQDFTANFRVRKDSLIWVTITAMGGMVQAARLLITHDSLWMINYIDKEVTTIPLTEVARILPAQVDFTSLQNLILGEPPRDGAITKASRFDGIWALDIKDTGYLQHISYNMMDSSMVQGQIRTVRAEGPLAMIDYGDYEVTNTKRISTRRVINIQNGQEVYSVDVKFISQGFDLEVDFPFYMPKNYTKKNDENSVK